jgi:hypothetical protein
MTSTLPIAPRRVFAEVDSGLRLQFWLVASLMFADAVTTYIALSEAPDGFAGEGWPIARWAMGYVGLAGFCIGKALVGTLMAAWAASITYRLPTRWWQQLGFVHRFPFVGRIDPNVAMLSARRRLPLYVALMGVVVGNNLHALKMLFSPPVVS